MTEMEYNGDIFLLPEPGARDACLVTTNGIVRKDGKAVMGAGIAKYCRDTFIGCDETLARKLKAGGNHVYSLGLWHKPDKSGAFMLFSFPTKNDWKDNSSLELIRQSCREMVDMVKDEKLTCVYMPCPGCSNGRLDYWKDVRLILLEELNDRFVVCIPTNIMAKRPKAGGSNA